MHVQILSKHLKTQWSCCGLECDLRPALIHLSIISCHLSSIHIYSELHTTTITLIGLYKESFMYAGRLDNLLECILLKG